MKYILYPDARKKPLFFSSYGSYIHSLLEQYYKGNIKASDLPIRYSSRFYSAVAKAPNEKIYQNYFKQGLDYLKAFTPLPCQPLGVEQKVAFKIGDFKFIGFVDLVGRTEKGIELIDHKSKDLKPYSKKKTPTQTDIELDNYFRQLYLYSKPISEVYQETPTQLTFNCFRQNRIITADYDKKKADEAVSWAENKIWEIADEEEWEPKLDFFKCKNICDMHPICDYFKYI